MIERQYALSSHVLLEREDGSDDVIVIDGRTGVICTTNLAASLLLQDLKEGACGASDLIGKLVARFRIPEENAREDVRDFLAQLNAMDLMHVSA